MATSGTMTKTIAQATRIPESKIALVVRELREAGLLTKGARGVNAARMTPLDAARVLIAVLVSDRPTDAPKAVRDFGHFLCFETTPNEGLIDSQEFTIDLPAGHSFEDSVAAIIQRLADDSKRTSWVTLRQLLDTSRIDKSIKEPCSPPKITIAVHLDVSSCIISLPKATMQFVNLSMIDMFLKSINNRPEAISGDLARRVMTEATAYKTSEILVRREISSEVLVPISADFAGARS
jgi:hypothetical protein